MLKMAVLFNNLNWFSLVLKKIYIYLKYNVNFFKKWITTMHNYNYFVTRMRLWNSDNFNKTTFLGCIILSRMCEIHIIILCWYESAWRPFSWGTVVRRRHLSTDWPADPKSSCPERRASSLSKSKWFIMRHAWFWHQCSQIPIYCILLGCNVSACCQS